MRVRERMEYASLRAGRRSESVRLVAVTKRVEVERIREAWEAGAADLGENYVQEARDKKAGWEEGAPQSATLPAWHLIGGLQSNKAKYAVRLFDLIQSVDRLTLAQEIDRQAAKIDKIQPVLIEVNLAHDPNRTGVPPEEALTLAEKVATLSHLALRGLMGVAPAPQSGGDGGKAARDAFRQLRGLWEQLPEPNRSELSMGMSGDFEIAIEEGATLVRIGTALFGSRKAP